MAEDQTFVGQDFSGCSWRDQVFTSCVFENCIFIEADFSSAQFSDCRFKRCNLHLVRLDGCRLQEVTFEGSKVVGAELYRCAGRFFSPRFEGCMLMGCNFSEAKMKNGFFRGCKIHDCSFSSSQLVGADFREADLAGTTFHHTDLSKADFRGAMNYSIDPQANTVKKARFSVPEVLSLLDFLAIEYQ